MKRLVILAVVAIAVAGACSSGSSKDASKDTSQPDWDATSLKVADGLKAKLDAAKETCTKYQPEDYAGVSTLNAHQGLPIPLAVTDCLGKSDEDLTTEVFADAATAQQFIQAKRAILCQTSAKNNIKFPGFFYVDGGSWVVEPDTQSTAKKLAPILGGTAKIGDCKGL